MLEIILPHGFTETEQAMVLRYLEDVVGPGHDWPGLVRTFNRLREAIVVIPSKGRRTFASLYTRLIDSRLTDPFITALYGLDDLVIFLKTPMWDEINGETLLVAWRELESCLPQPARIVCRGEELIVSDYEVWKEKMRAYETRQEVQNGRTKDDRKHLSRGI